MTATFEAIRYRKPALAALPRGITSFGGSDVMRSGVHTLAPGGRQGLHAHAGYDQLYVVLSGRVRFYGEANVLIAELGPHEAVTIPRDTPYGFEAAGEEAELLFCNARVPGAEDRFVSHEPGSDDYVYERFTPDGTPLGKNR